jgi:hypothetical protein
MVLHESEPEAKPRIVVISFASPVDTDGVKYRPSPRDSYQGPKLSTVREWLEKDDIMSKGYLFQDADRVFIPRRAEDAYTLSDVIQVCLLFDCETEKH